MLTTVLLHLQDLPAVVAAFGLEMEQLDMEQLPGMEVPREQAHPADLRRVFIYAHVVVSQLDRLTSDAGQGLDGTKLVQPGVWRSIADLLVSIGVQIKAVPAERIQLSQTNIIHSKVTTAMHVAQQAHTMRSQQSDACTVPISCCCVTDSNLLAFLQPTTPTVHLQPYLGGHASLHQHAPKHSAALRCATTH